MEGSNIDKKPYKSLLITVATILFVSFAIIMINQISQLIQTATAVNPILGQILLLFFAILALLAAFSVISIMVKLEKPLDIPDENNIEEYSKYITKLKSRLMKNKFIKNNNYLWDNKRPDIEVVNGALMLLDEESLKLIKEESSAIFLTTAVSQNGSLDSIFVFVTATKLVWKIAMLYNQRPAISDLTKLYSNVFGTVLMSRQIDDLDLLSEQLEPVISSLFSGTVGTIVPGVSYAVSFIIDSILEGSINTLLMLRIGLITQKYCGSISKLEQRTLGKAATIQASKLLGTLINENSKKITDAVIKSIKNATADAIHRGKKSIFDNFKNFTGI